MVMLIYVSAYDKYVLELFRLDVFAFLKKPIDKKLFTKAFLEVNKKICNKVFFFTFSSNGEELPFANVTPLLDLERISRKLTR
mgnify:CR=1 FL=1